MQRLLRKLFYPAVFSGVYLAVVFLFSVCAYYLDMSDEALSVGAFVISVGCVLICSILTGKISEKNGWLEGMFSGMIFTGIIFVISVLLSSGDVDILKVAVRIPLFLLTSFIGGIMGINLK